MPVISFFPSAGPLPLGRLAEIAQARLSDADAAGRLVSGVAPLEGAGPHDVSFLDNPAYAAALERTQAGACFVAEKHLAKVPSATVALVTAQPYRAYAQAAAALFPASVAAGPSVGSMPPALAHVHPEARLEAGVLVEAGAVVGAGAEIGAGSVIGPTAVIGAGVRIGRGCQIGAGATLMHALIGDRVVIHAGVRIGQDGFGFAMGPGGHLKVPQLGRVIIQDDVEIGANSTIDRGATRDTVIGEGTKIDNLVQIAHNVTIGRHCVIVSQVGISGSAVLEDYVVLAGQAGVAGHVRIGAGAQVGAKSGVMHDVPAGARFAGQPAKPAREVFREIATLSRLASREGQGRG